MKETSASLCDTLSQFVLAHKSNAWYVGVSGGWDSVALVAALAHLRDTGRLTAPLTALHVDHGTCHASDFVQHSMGVCDRLAVPLQVLRQNDSDSQFEGKATEEHWRRVRYDLFSQVLESGGTILLAHHSHDQAENFLLRSLRSASIRGLGEMSRYTPLGGGFLGRPWLDCTPMHMQELARDFGLEGIHDPENDALRHDRNFLRHAVMPLLVERWPHAQDNMAQVSRLLADAASLLNELGKLDYDRASLSVGNDEVERSAYFKLSAPRRENLVRSWCHRLGYAPPPAQVLQNDSCLRSPNGKVIWRNWRNGLVKLHASASNGIWHIKLTETTHENENLRNKPNGKASNDAKA